MRFRIVLLSAAVLVLCACVAGAQSFVEVEKDGDLVFRGRFDREWDRETGFFVYGSSSKKWSQIYGGVTMKPVSWIKISTGFGAGSDEDWLRFGSSIFVGNERVRSLLIYEQNTTVSWYKYTATGYFGRIGVGLLSQTEIGTGPLVEIGFGSGFYATASYTRKKTLLVGLGKTFKS